MNPQGVVVRAVRPGTIPSQLLSAWEDLPAVRGGALVELLDCPEATVFAKLKDKFA